MAIQLSVGIHIDLFNINLLKMIEGGDTDLYNKHFHR